MISNFKHETLWTKDELIKASKGEDPTGKFLKEKKVTGISIDTRSIRKNDLFIAIKGKKYDGHDFVKKAKEKGASGVIVSCKYSALKFKGLFVKNTSDTLINLAKFSRNRFKGQLIGITGSNGKTTTKDMAKIIFSEFDKTFVTPGNNNNIIGLSLSLMKLPYDFRYCILELGMNKKNELKKLSLIAKPDVIIITNVSNNHLENFESEGDIALAKSEIFYGLKENGKIILNYDNKWFKFLKKTALNYSNDIIPFGFKKSIFSVLQKKGSFLITTKNFKTNINHLPQYLVLNLISILTVIKCLNLDLNKIKEKIKYLTPSDGRGNQFKLKINSHKTITIINDAYNSSPNSLEASLTNLSINNKHKYVLIIGDMLELGSNSHYYHKKIVPFIKRINPKTLFTIGNLSKILSDNLKNSIFCKHFKNVKLLESNFDELINDNDIVFIKGSNSIGLYDFCKNLEKNYKLGE